MCVGQQLKDIESAEIDYLHYDIIDGNFAPDFTMGSSIINKIIQNTSLRSDYHLMVDEPNRIFNIFKFSAGDFFTIHLECARNLHRDLVRIRQLGARVGVALSPGTSLDALEYIVEDVDLVLLMTVNPGYMGQPLVPQVLRKVQKLRSILNNTALNGVRISVDGNVNADTIPDMVAAGADNLVLGSSGLFRKDRNILDMANEIRDAIDLGLKARG